MGRAKASMEERDAYASIAETVLVDADLAEKCEVCGDVTTESSFDPVDAYKLANARISSGEIELPDGMSRTDFTDIIKNTYEQLPMECFCQVRASRD